MYYSVQALQALSFSRKPKGGDAKLYNRINIKCTADRPGTYVRGTRVLMRGRSRSDVGLFFEKVNRHVMQMWANPRYISDFQKAFDMVLH